MARDWIDQELEAWARVWREVNGYSDPKLASGFLGALRCTLGERRDLHAGSRSNRLEQHWPEVFTGRELVVNRAVRSMSPSLQQIVAAHYIATVPKNRTLRADLMGLSRKSYFERVRVAKAFIHGALVTADEKGVHKKPG